MSEVGWPNSGSCLRIPKLMRSPRVLQCQLGHFRICLRISPILRTRPVIRLACPCWMRNYLILSTIHSAKGQEWKSVYLLNAVDGCMPSDLGVGTSAEIEEERRLLYVAMTRAKDDLHLIVPQRFFVHGQHAQGDRHLYASRARFISEKLLALFERTNWPVAAPGLARGPSLGPRIDIGARMRGMWR